MTTNQIVASQTTTFTANSDQTEYIVLAGVNVSSTTGAAIDASTTLANRGFVIDGHLYGNRGINLATVETGLARVDVGETGSVYGSTQGILLAGAGINEVTNSGEISGGNGIQTNGDGFYHITNLGQVVSTVGGGTGIIVGAGGKAAIRNAGAISGNSGIQINNADVDIDNTGTIIASVGAAINLVTGGGIPQVVTLKVDNSGAIQGGSRSFFLNNATTTFELNNSGTISGDILVLAIDASNSITNSGIINGDIDFSDVSSSERFDNRAGRVAGDVDLGDGDDVLILTDGASVAGIVTGGGGDDTYLIDGATNDIQEIIDSGTDIVISRVSYRLGDNFEILEFTGSDALRGFGNALDNTLTGNDGDNRLFGRAGDDVLQGGAGADVLNGGEGFDRVTYANSFSAVTIDLAKSKVSGGDADGDQIVSIERAVGSGFADRITGSRGANILDGGEGKDRIAGGKGADSLIGGTGGDTFVFATGNGKDDILDFSRAENDRIDLTHLSGVTSFADLKANHLSSDGSILIISSGADELRIFNLDVSDIAKGDFLF